MHTCVSSYAKARTTTHAYIDRKAIGEWNINKACIGDVYTVMFEGLTV